MLCLRKQDAVNRKVLMEGVSNNQESLACEYRRRGVLEPNLNCLEYNHLSDLLMIMLKICPQMQGIKIREYSTW
jgi:hypothetical protein